MTVTPAALSALLSGDMPNFRAASTPGGIEAQEAQGQRDLVSNFDRLPLRMSQTEKETAIAFGFEFGEPIDEVFMSVKAPEGWTLRASDHNMHSDILDGSGALRGNMFYKAAFYDRRADLSWNSRYSVQCKRGDETTIYVGTDARDNVAVIEPVEVPTPQFPADRDYTNYDAARVVEQAAEAKMREQLAELFPDYSNPAAYWND